jgi:hypothetical protein
VTKPMRKRWEMHVARTGRGEVHTGFQWEKLKETLGRPRHRWEDNFRISWKSVHWEPSCSMQTDRQTWRSQLSLFAILWMRLKKKGIRKHDE